MEKKSTKIAIIGAGISGIVAALTLEKEGYAPTIYEASDRVGGRVKTDVVEGYQLDHGFQVLLEAYPMAQKYLDYDTLQLQKFLPGAQLFKEGKSDIIGDPLRSFSLLLPTLLSNVGNFTDKIKVLQLNASLKKKKLEAIFKEPETTTLDFLKSFGFSEEMITHFFKPFFSGIFLEPELTTSSRMFQFVYKMFGSGLAVLPKAGIGAIPEQLAKKLNHTKIDFNSEVESCTDEKITFLNGKSVHPDFTIIAADAAPLVPNLRKQQLNWHSCDTLYFTTDTKVIDKPLIGLISEPGALINNIFYHTALEMEHKGEKELLSVTIVKKHDLTEYQLIQKVKEELKHIVNITTDRYLGRYEIARALPKLKDIRNEVIPTETRLMQSTFLAGDYLLNGSLNAAMTSGEMAAKGVMEAIEKG